MSVLGGVFGALIIAVTIALIADYLQLSRSELKVVAFLRKHDNRRRLRESAVLSIQTVYRLHRLKNGGFAHDAEDAVRKQLAAEMERASRQGLLFTLWRSMGGGSSSAAGPAGGGTPGGMRSGATAVSAMANAQRGRSARPMNEQSGGKAGAAGSKRPLLLPDAPAPPGRSASAGPPVAAAGARDAGRTAGRPPAVPSGAAGRGSDDVHSDPKLLGGSKDSAMSREPVLTTGAAPAATTIVPLHEGPPIAPTNGGGDGDGRPQLTAESLHRVASPAPPMAGGQPQHGLMSPLLMGSPASGAPITSPSGITGVALNLSLLPGSLGASSGAAATASASGASGAAGTGSSSARVGSSHRTDSRPHSSRDVDAAAALGLYEGGASGRIPSARGRNGVLRHMVQGLGSTRALSADAAAGPGLRGPSSKRHLQQQQQHGHPKVAALQLAGLSPRGGLGTVTLTELQSARSARSAQDRRAGCCGWLLCCWGSHHCCRRHLLHSATAHGDGSSGSGGHGPLGSGRAASTAEIRLFERLLFTRVEAFRRLKRWINSHDPTDPMDKQLTLLEALEVNVEEIRGNVDVLSEFLLGLNPTGDGQMSGDRGASGGGGGHTGRALSAASSAASARPAGAAAHAGASAALAAQESGGGGGTARRRTPPAKRLAALVTARTEASATSGGGGGAGRPRLGSDLSPSGGGHGAWPLAFAGDAAQQPGQAGDGEGRRSPLSPTGTFIEAPLSPGGLSAPRSPTSHSTSPSTDAAGVGGFGGRGGGGGARAYAAGGSRQDGHGALSLTAGQRQAQGFGPSQDARGWPGPGRAAHRGDGTPGVSSRGDGSPLLAGMPLTSPKNVLSPTNLLRGVKAFERWATGESGVASPGRASPGGGPAVRTGSESRASLQSVSSATTGPALRPRAGSATQSASATDEDGHIGIGLGTPSAPTSGRPGGGAQLSRGGASTDKLQARIVQLSQRVARKSATAALGSTAAAAAAAAAAGTARGVGGLLQSAGDARAAAAQQLVQAARSSARRLRVSLAEGGAGTERSLASSKLGRSHSGRSVAGLDGEAHRQAFTSTASLSSPAGQDLLLSPVPEVAEGPSERSPHRPAAAVADPRSPHDLGATVQRLSAQLAATNAALVLLQSAFAEHVRSSGQRIAQLEQVLQAVLPALAASTSSVPAAPGASATGTAGAAAAAAASALSPAATHAAGDSIPPLALGGSHASAVRLPMIGAAAAAQQQQAQSQALHAQPQTVPLAGPPLSEWVEPPASSSAHASGSLFDQLPTGRTAAAAATGIDSNRTLSDRPAGDLMGSEEEERVYASLLGPYATPHEAGAAAVAAAAASGQDGHHQPPPQSYGQQGASSVGTAHPSAAAPGVGAGGAPVLGGGVYAGSGTGLGGTGGAASPHSGDGRVESPATHAQPRRASAPHHSGGSGPRAAHSGPNSFGPGHGHV